MKKPILVVLAAGMGSRYGGLKQMEPVGPNGEVIIDYSMYDAKKAGFDKVVFIIKQEIAQDFKEIIGQRAEKFIEVDYAYQELENLPQGFSLPEGRQKPFGTSHALLCAKDQIDAPFAIINADDYYGMHAFEKIYKFLVEMDAKSTDYAMVGYRIENTVTENGTVTRGVCKANENDYLYAIEETSGIEKYQDGARVKNGEEYQNLPKGTLVSMNFWGFNDNFIRDIEQDFSVFLEKNLKNNPQKCEYLLPICVKDLIEYDRATIKVLETHDQWVGVTYKEDKEIVVKTLKELHGKNIYPSPLW